jgi:hypothetical protein
VDRTSGSQNVIITIVPGPRGPEFDRTQLRVPVGALTIWMNRTGTEQVILPDAESTRRVMRLAPSGSDGHVWMMQMQSSRQPSQQGGTFRWRLASNDRAHVTIVTGGEPARARE